MIGRWRWIVRLLTRRLWFKASLYGIAAIISALAAIWIAPLVPPQLAGVIGEDAVQGILNIVASSMLAVATFSLGTMVAAFAAAASAATPRASKLLVDDPISQNVLSTFVGAFIFSLVGLIALSTGAYGPGGRFVLFAVSVVVIAAVLVTFFRWIDYLSNLGRLSETLTKVERAAVQSVKERLEHPFLGGVQMDPIPSAAIVHHGESLGYVQHIDVSAIQEVAEEAKGRVWIGRIPGNWSDETSPLFWTSWRPDEKSVRVLYKAFLVGDTRSFDQDPRFGIIVLSEVASRALSPGINDPGTAIDVIGRITRVLFAWGKASPPDKPPECPRVSLPAIDPKDVFDDAFGPIARDGAGTLEVGIRLQKALASLARFDPARFGQPAAIHSGHALALSEKALALEDQKGTLRRLASLVFDLDRSS